MNDNVGAAFSRRPQRKMHPWLMVCFVVGWGLLTVLVVLQDHAIDAQRELIQLLLQDLHKGLTTSVAYHTGASVPVVLKQGEASAAEVTGSNAPSVQVPSKQLPSQQVQSQSTPSLQVPAVPSSKVPSQGKGLSRTPSSQGKNAAGANPGRSSRKAAKPLPVRPPAEITDPSDMRRVKLST